MKKLIILSCCSLLTLTLIGCVQTANADGSVAIIGGADGPTSIFVTSNFPLIPILLSAFIVLTVIVAVLYFKMRK